MPNDPNFLRAVLDQLHRPSVETMGIEELRAEVLALRTMHQTLFDIWQEAENDVDTAHRDGAAWMQKACLEWVAEWAENDPTHDTDVLFEGVENLPLPNLEGDEDAE